MYTGNYNNLQVAYRFGNSIAPGSSITGFWAEWCGPCRTMSPIVDELAAEYEGKVVIGKCDVEENDCLLYTSTLTDGSPVSYTSRMTIRIPVEKIRRAPDADPLLFMGENPDEHFHAWAKMRIRYDGRFTEKGGEGVVHGRFYIEPDGRIAIGEVVQSPDERLTKEAVSYTHLRRKSAKKDFVTTLRCLSRVTSCSTRAN